MLGLVFTNATPITIKMSITNTSFLQTTPLSRRDKIKLQVVF